MKHKFKEGDLVRVVFGMELVGLLGIVLNSNGYGSLGSKLFFVHLQNGDEKLFYGNALEKTTP